MGGAELVGGAIIQAEQTRGDPVRSLDGFHNLEQRDIPGWPCQCNAAPVTALGGHQSLVDQVIDDPGKVRLGDARALRNVPDQIGVTVLLIQTDERLHGVTSCLREAKHTFIIY